MSDFLRYKSFLVSVEVSVKDNCLHGELLFIDDLVTYEAQTPTQLETEFKAAVDDYLETCKELDREPMKPFSGSFNVRVGPELHQKVAKTATFNNTSINDIVKKALIDYLEKPAEGA